jgi:hypothetical protein
MEKPYGEIGWLLLEQEASHIFFDPLRRSELYPKTLSPKAVQSCPAVQMLLNRSFAVRCPFDIRLRLVPAPEGPHIHVIESDTSINTAKLRSIFTLMPREEWRHREYPVVQLSTPYVFVSSQPAFINQRHPPETAPACAWRLVEGRFPIHQWVRPLSWAVEWLDKERDIQIRRGEIWFNLDFETTDPSVPVRLYKTAVTDEIRRELLATKNVASYIKGTFSLFGTAQRRRQTETSERSNDPS